MKKNSIVFLVFGVFFLSACTTTNQLSQDELFEKKQECFNMKEEIKQKQFLDNIVTDIFYNEKLNTCLYVRTNKGAKMIADVFNDNGGMSSLYESDTEYWCDEIPKDMKADCLRKSKNFDEKLKELKGE